MAEVRVFLADDHAIVRGGLKALIDAQQGMAVVGEAADGLEACARVAALGPDVVIMDVSMPGLTGALATERLRRECPAVKVLVLTVHEDKGYIRQLLTAGASGYALKRAAPEELVRAIRTVAAGGVYLDPAVAQKVVGGFVKPSPKGATGAAGAGELSEREAEVARLTAAGHGNKEIAARLELSVKTVETYRARALEKLGLKSRAELVSYAFQQGWLKDG
ncbi:Oxygen regulatory protein NreC [Gemmata obscuriglobus]|uniref:DNA-binding response regulator n=1 Tax=Gemmata obscuriglobus TaxID=114 RepID=A0A2Z3H9N1_9BACT|nr:response regulator transcription factor [Gemmata obscuriglobus]AWM37800.1 DNA-binding response regulator [Gemmata obscuriglobus]QEG29381.1 Oxygen regulatory protein NreC [Gemmata obscuriglobus]VTS08435.1 family transcriptional regulator : Two component transcriptional regulator, LuxR family OS=Methylocella silvestris (strain BL2 / DSM 15510 / NCIMB 13906) GN=Msil_2019 PE=4 SV=1: Response_reg: GerE [Gemmata obscuriglobus UQM 2246]